MQDLPVPFLLYPIFFAALWLLVTMFLTWASGWKALEARFPDKPDETGRTIHMASGVLCGVSMRNILTLTACPMGLRVSVWKLFGPLDRPFLVPWEQIGVTRRGSGFWGHVILTFGGEHQLRVSTALADSLATAASGRWPEERQAHNAPIVS